jgi:uncharacterized protein (UPF0335 family)
MTHVEMAHDMQRARVQAPEAPEATDEINSGHLRSYVERIERLHEERKALGEDIKEVYAEAKGNGFDPKILKAVVRIRAKDPSERTEEETLIDLYLAALGSS